MPPDLSTTNRPDETVSLFSELSSRLGADATAGWAVVRGGLGIDSLQRSMLQARSTVGTAPQRQSPADPQTFVRTWLHERHAASRTDTPPLLLCLADRTRIWSAHLMSHLEASEKAARSRVDLVSHTADGGALSLSHIGLVRDGTASLHIYSAEVRERNPAAVASIEALQCACDYLLQFIGPMRAETLAEILGEVRQRLQSPQSRLRAVVFAVSPAASVLRPQLEAFGEAMGPRAAAFEANLADMSEVWSRGLATLQACTSIELPDEDKDTDAVVPAADDEQADAVQGLLESLAATEGTAWIALLDASGRSLALAGRNGATTATEQLERLAFAFDSADDATHDSWMVDSGNAITIALPLSEPRLRLAASFDCTEVHPALARLLAGRMRDELEALGATA